MRRLALAAALGLALAPTVARARAPQPSVLPGQPGGDPAPDTAAAVDLIKKGRYEDAITASKRSLVRDEHYVPALMAMAKAYYYLKKYELSAAILELAQKLDANNAESYNILGWIALARSDGTAATANFKKATELKDDYGIAWHSLTAQYLLSKNYDAAVPAAEKAASLLPNFEKAHLNLGSAYRGKQMFPEAEREYRKALEINPSYADAYFNLGILYLDAPPGKVGGDLDLVAKLNTAVVHLNKYKNLASFRLKSDDPADGYIDEARKGIEREQKRLERQKKQQERDRAKAAQQPPPAAPAPAAPPPAGGGNP